MSGKRGGTRNTGFVIGNVTRKQAQAESETPEMRNQRVLEKRVEEARETYESSFFSKDNLIQVLSSAEKYEQIMDRFHGDLISLRAAIEEDLDFTDDEDIEIMHHVFKAHKKAFVPPSIEEVCRQRYKVACDEFRILIRNAFGGERSIMLLSYFDVNSLIAFILNNANFISGVNVRACYNKYMEAFDKQIQIIMDTVQYVQVSENSDNSRDCQKKAEQVTFKLGKKTGTNRAERRAKDPKVQSRARQYQNEQAQKGSEGTKISPEKIVTKNKNPRGQNKDRAPANGRKNKGRKNKDFVPDKAPVLSPLSQDQVESRIRGIISRLGGTSVMAEQAKTAINNLY